MTNPTQAQRSLALDIKMGTFRNGFPVDYNEEELAQLIASHVAEEVAKATKHLKRNVSFLVKDAIEHPSFIEIILKEKCTLLEQENEYLRSLKPPTEQEG